MPPRIEAVCRILPNRVFNVMLLEDSRLPFDSQGHKGTKRTTRARRVEMIGLENVSIRASFVRRSARRSARLRVAAMVEILENWGPWVIPHSASRDDEHATPALHGRTCAGVRIRPTFPVLIFAVPSVSSAFNSIVTL